MANPPGIRIHSRTREVQLADSAIRLAAEKIVKEHQLTSTELLQILASYQLSVLKYVLRHERHPDDPDKGADEE